MGVWMGMQPCGHADADGCKQKKKKTLTGVFRTCGWACRRAEADNCKEKKKEKLTGLGMWTCYGWACVRLWADVDGCKQTNEKRGKKKEMEWTYRRWWA